MKPTLNQGARHRWLQLLLVSVLALKQWVARNILGRVPRLLPLLRRVYHRVLARLIQRTGLFDAQYYLESNPDVARSGCDPVLHYVSHGDPEGRQPAPLFDPVYYRQQLQGEASGLNALLHYAWIGRARGVSPSPWFDRRFYLSRYPDVAAMDIDPAEHYLKWGGAEGRAPSPRFDGAYYLRNNPDVAASRVNPLLHYLKYGRAEGRLACPVGGNDTDAAPEEGDNLPPPSLPSDTDWQGLQPRLQNPGVQVDVIVPVYKGRAETLRCILTVLRAPVNTPYSLIVIDDASPDEDLSADLERLAGQGLFSLLRNEINRGFVATVNRGMSLHPQCDVVLLNSDTEVYGDWLDRLCSVAEAHPTAATLTPLSNNATICSYPRFAYDNPYPLEVEYDRLDALAAQLNRGIVVDCPSGVGFCMFIRRAALDAVGLFDADTFGLGYGEENDFCQRALAKGWRNLITAEVFVRHLGAMSFQGDKTDRVAEATKTIGRLYPRYHQDVQTFIAADPLHDARHRLDWGRMTAQSRASNVLMVCHSRGGGTERYLREATQRYETENVGVFRLRPTHYDPARILITHSRVRNAPNLHGFHVADLPRLSQACRELGITEIQVHSCIDFSPDTPDILNGLAAELGVSLNFHIHDYESICPRINLADEQGMYCGEPTDPSACNRCLATRGCDSGARDIEAWRTQFGRALQDATRVLVPDRDVASRLQRYYPALIPEVQPHDLPPDMPEVSNRAPSRSQSRPVRVVVIGAISPIKGYHVLRSCAEWANKHRQPLEFVLMGYSYDDQGLQRAGVTVTGRYEDDQALSRLNDLAPDLIWLPSTAPETYSYTLSLAMQTGYPVVAFDLGAVASRLRCAKKYPHTLLPLSLVTDPKGLNEQLVHARHHTNADPAPTAELDPA